MDPKQVFFTLGFGLFGGYLVWTGLRGLRRPPADGRGASSRKAAGRDGLSVLVGLLLWAALFVMYGPASAAP